MQKKSRSISIGKNTKVCDKFDKIEVEGRNKIGVYNTLRFEDHIKIEIIKKYDVNFF
jgi:hypothetical protein